jgi:hypothetical protein
LVQKKKREAKASLFFFWSVEMGALIGANVRGEPVTANEAPRYSGGNDMSLDDV